ncbi:MAG TPA: hypothetical protein VNA87_05110 [Actinomycetota bacterium]|nr:hypothetical protein [Actinomycetota bacterium]
MSVWLRAISIGTAAALLLGACSSDTDTSDDPEASVSEAAPLPTTSYPTDSLPAFVEAEIAVGSGPGYLTVAADDVWVGNHPGQSISRIDPHTNEVTATIDIRGEPTAMATGFGGVWTHTVLQTNHLLKIDPETNDIVGKLPYPGMGGSINGITAGAGSMWFALDNGSVLQVDPSGTKVIAKVRITKRCLGMITYGAGSVWYACGTRDLWRIDVATLEVDRFEVGPGSTNPTFGLGSVWVPSPPSGRVARVDPSTGEVVDTFRVGETVDQVRIDGQDLWVRLSPRELVRVDSRTLKIVQRFEGFPTAPIPGGGLTIANGSVWVANFGTGTVWRIDPNV